MKIFYFDLCAIPIYVLILCTCYIRGMNKGRANRLFIVMVSLSLIATIFDILMEKFAWPLPLTQTRVALGTAFSFGYLLTHNFSTVIYFLYLFSVTRTEYRLQSLGVRLLTWLPCGAMLILLLQNFFTHNVFSFTVEAGYSRQPLMGLLYGIAFFYFLIGTLYCLYCRRYLLTSKWIALISVYVLILASVIIQMMEPKLLVEMFATSLGVLMVLMLIIRPE